jgi:hypothetical protein
LFRVPGNTAAVQSLKEAVNRGLDVALLDQDQRWSDVNVISSLLKLFFRGLPDCLLTTELYPSFIQADKIDDPKLRIATIRKLVSCNILPTNEGGYHYVVSQTEIEFVYKNSIYFALLVHDYLEFISVLLTMH